MSTHYREIAVLDNDGKETGQLAYYRNAQYGQTLGLGEPVSLTGVPGKSVFSKIAGLMQNGDSYTDADGYDYVKRDGHMVNTYSPTGRLQMSGKIRTSPHHNSGIAYTAPMLTPRGFAGLCLPTAKQLRAKVGS